MLKYIFILSLLFSLTSCIELIDDILINSDGTGTFKYTINLSSSKIKCNSILALDTIEGKKVPKLPELKKELENFEKTFSSQPGIKNVKIESDWTNFIFRFSCDFTDVSSLQSAFKMTGVPLGSELKLEDWLVWDGKILERNIPNIISKDFLKSSYIKEQDLKLGKYNSISRFQKEIKSFDNKNSILSKSKTAIMIKTDMWSFLNDFNKLDNKIYLVK